MAQYIDKSALVAEIERRLDELYDLLPDASKVENGSITTSEACNTGKYTALESFRNYINTLEMKEVDLEHLEQEVKDFCYKFDDRKDKWYDMTPHDKNIMISPTWSNFAMQLAKHFFTLGLFSQLTWQDIRLISEIGEDFMNSEESDDLWKDEEVYYTAILNKLKEKGRDYKTERQITRELEQKGEEV